LPPVGGMQAPRPAVAASSSQGPFGSWAQEHLRALPRFPHHDSFPTARNLINHFLLGEGLLYRDLRIALFWLGFDLLDVPTPDEPTINLVPLCKDLHTYTDTAAELGYDPEASVHSQPVCLAGQPPADCGVLGGSVSGGPSSSSHSNSSSSSHGPGPAATASAALPSLAPPAAPLIRIALPSSPTDDAGIPVPPPPPPYTTGKAAPVSVLVAAAGASKASPAGVTGVAAAALDDECLERKLAECQGSSASFGAAQERSGARPPCSAKAGSWLHQERGAASDDGREDEEDEDGVLLSGCYGTGAAMVRQPQLHSSAASSRAWNLDGAAATGGLAFEAAQALSCKVKLLHSGGWSSSSGSDGSSRPPTPPTPSGPRALPHAAATAGELGQQAGGLDANHVEQFTVSFVSDLQTQEDFVEPSNLCTFCQDDMEIGEELCRLPCMHTFHRRCIHAWLERDRRCMLCRLDVTQPRG